MAEVELKDRFLIAGQANLFKKTCCNTDMMNYFVDLSNHYKLENKEVKGMYKYIVQKRNRPPPPGGSSAYPDDCVTPDCASRHKTIAQGRIFPPSKAMLGRPSGILFGLQEPGLTPGNRVSGFPQYNIIEDKGAETPVRAAIVASPGVDIWPAPEFTSPDMATGLLVTNNKDFPYIYVVSLYLDYQDKIVDGRITPPLLHRLLAHCRAESTQILILADVNAHCSALNSPDINDRGRAMDNFLINHHLITHNVGAQWTFLREEQQSIIDATISSVDLKPYITNWLVRDAAPCSDHASLEFVFHFEGAASVIKRDYVHADWNAFKSNVEQAVMTIQTPLVWTVNTLETITSRFTEIIQAEVEACCPKKKVKPFGRKLTWQTPELGAQRRKLLQIKRYRDRWLDGPRQADSVPRYTHEDLVEVRREYTRNNRTARDHAWRDFIESCDDFHKVARLNRILKGRITTEVGLLKAGGKVLDPEETLTHLCETHFPGSLPNKPTQARRHKASCRPMDPRAQFISVERITASIMSFGAMKGAGPDGLPPIVFQNLGALALCLLTDIYRASYLLSYLPEAWLKIRVIFIPKPGKDDYGIAKAFRPISLMNFIMKILEKAIVWHNEEMVMENNPFHYTQHGFRKGRSCESALTQAVGIIETAFAKQNITVGVSLDINGAYDNITNNGMEEAMRKRGCDPLFIAWYSDFLRSREISVEYKGIKSTHYPVKGAPQGGIGSPFLWNLILDSLLGQFDRLKTTHVCAYADDVLVLSQGSTLAPILGKMQKAVDTCIQWSNKNQLEFSPSKTKAIIFTNKRLPENKPHLTISGTQLKWSGQIKHLGVWLDSKLRFTYHIKEKIKTVRSTLVRLGSCMGKLWGVSPLLALWAWKGVARPALTYGSIVWAKITRRPGVLKSLKRLQRSALKMMGFFRHSTPTAGLEMITHTLPLDLRIQETAIMAFMRTRWAPVVPPDVLHTNVEGLKGHRQYLTERMATLELEIEDIPLDYMHRVFNWARKYKVDRQSFKGNGIPDKDGDFQVYTDGSREEEDSGAAFVVVEMPLEGVIKEKPVYLGNTTVGQCETYAIGMGAEYIADNEPLFRDKRVVFYSDSLSTLQALDKWEVKSKNTLETVKKLNKAAAVCAEITLKWVKAHDSHTWNERADILAKQGKDSDNLVVTPPAIPLSTLKKEVRMKLAAFWDRRWDREEPCRQTKQWFPSRRPAFSFKIMRCPRILFSKVIQVITGHNFWRYHEYLVHQKDDPDLTPECDKCHQTGSRQSTFHIFAKCPAFMLERHEVFERPFLVDLEDITLDQLKRFLSEINMEVFPFELS